MTVINSTQNNSLDEKSNMYKNFEETDISYENKELNSDFQCHTQSSISDTSSKFLENKQIMDPLIKNKYKNLKTSNFYADEEKYIQEIKLDNENYLIISGININKTRQFIYYICCILSGEFIYLIFLWIPRLRVRFIFKRTPLNNCEWVAIENKYKEISLLEVKKEDHGDFIFPIYEGFQDVYDKSQNEDKKLERSYLRYIDYCYIRIIYSPKHQKFLPSYAWKDPRRILSIEDITKGLTTHTKNIREIIFGKNIIDIQENSVIRLLVNEILHYFYIFQLFSIILWMSDTYYYYATCILIITIVNIIVSLVKTKKNIRSFRLMSRYVTNVNVLRDGTWVSILSSELVPGDIFDISDPELSILPCDSILLTGDCIVNESSLTGESVPVSKIFVPENAIKSLVEIETEVPKELSKHYLFCGTKIIQARKSFKYHQARALAMVSKTGFNTAKGILIRSMLSEKPLSFKFYQDSLRFVAFMAIIALCGFIVNTIRFVQMGITWNLIFLRSLDLITIIVPPALPATLIIETNFAVSRLKKHQIYCISPSKVNISGKIDVMCFDKTGTLTEDGFDVLGVKVVDDSTNRLGEIHNKAQTLSFYTSNYNNLSPTNKENAMLYAMATCHSLRFVNNKLIGDPLDIKMFGFTGWIYEENQEHIALDAHFENSKNKDAVQISDKQIISSIIKPKKDLQINDIKDSNFQNISTFEFGIIKSFQFISHLRRMSVVVKKFNSTDMHVYLKGAPEIMKDVCQENSFPEDYDEVLSYYALHGFRIIACATKTLSNVSWAETQKMRREEIEKDLLFIGFIIFENKLKPVSADVIETLKNANIRCLMCTGDNALTSINVSKKCNIIQQDEDVYIASIQGNINSFDAKLLWKNVEDPKILLDNEAFIPQYNSSDLDDSSYYKTYVPKKYSLAITGDVFRWMIKFSPYTVLEKMLIKTQIFARMSPNEKKLLVKKLQSLGYCVGFCGDGTNDCGALKSANSGISFSKTEASIVSAFASKVYNISCVLDLIREGRTSLATSFSCFKYMALYSAIQFMTVSILYSSASNLGDFQYLYIDLILVFPIAIAMGKSKANLKLIKKRPAASLISKRVIGSLIGHICILISLQLTVYFLVRIQNWYQKPLPRSDLFDISNSDNSSLFLFSCYQYILIALILNIGPPYREPAYHNKIFVFIILFSISTVTYFLFKPATWIYEILELSYLKFDFCLFILGLAIFNYIISWVAEKYIFLPIARHLTSIIKMLFFPHKAKQRKRYKVVQDSLGF
ncbi:hypothetical protein PNEG_01004 [Pneumocystis murina B123]|uniref:Cation-transporting ATPase n=1 Tax=Pneumocystis murina (strain B123) TaxID=1069680 RepID=M7NQ75_PNEMU|nr:hypothetical protein PNEG_01004 [Pneumocystis murina B123]EMR10858.1 hypothetical protein PNEG_01004 [Pneumocystis murina B123]